MIILLDVMLNIWAERVLFYSIGLFTPYKMKCSINFTKQQNTFIMAFMLKIYYYL